jgi:hypothetical protein
MNTNTYIKILVTLTILFLLMTSIDSGAPPNQDGNASQITPGFKEGQILYSPIKGTNSLLINETGAVTHTWSSSYCPNLASYMLDNGTILYSIASGNGGFQKIAWNSTVLWEYHYTRDSSFASHDLVPLPNGDVLMIMQDMKSRDATIQAGRDPQTVGTAFSPDSLIQVHQTGPESGDIVWEWHIWDHLIQHFDATKDNYGRISDHPELVDINYGENFDSDWIHMNSVDYNPAYDQILMSAHNLNELWIIDHSTTTEQAAGHTDGIYKHGGDLLYRWGNPQAYGRGNENDRKLFFQHQCTWINPGFPGAGNILVFNNGNNRPGGQFSTVDEFIPPVNASGGYYLPPGGIFGPENDTWQYRLPDNLYSSTFSGAQRMLNGNTLICCGPEGIFTEVTPDQTVVWTYVNPYPQPSWNSVYKIQYIPPNLPAEPKLSVSGDLNWVDVKPGATVKGSFQVQNSGDENSWLNWTVKSSLTWGDWTFSPESGTKLTPQDGPVTINVTCIVPHQKDTQFQGSLQVQDLDNASDYGSVMISIFTPYTPPHLFPLLWQWITRIIEELKDLGHHT